MSDFAFSKGEDVVLRVNSEILGGVSRVGCALSSSVAEIKEFLTDAPVYRTVKNSYEITLNMYSEGENIFYSLQSFDSLELSQEGETVVYSDCTLKSIESVINPKGEIEYTVVINAEERNVK